MAKKNWTRPFEDPIVLPDGRKLLTLKNAADYIMKLPKAEQKQEKWQTAVKVLIMAAEQLCRSRCGTKGDKVRRIRPMCSGRDPISGDERS
jgi:hypothetical protein